MAYKDKAQLIINGDEQANRASTASFTDQISK